MSSSASQWAAEPSVAAAWPTGPIIIPPLLQRRTPQDMDTSHCQIYTVQWPWVPTPKLQSRMAHTLWLYSARHKHPVHCQVSTPTDPRPHLTHVACPCGAGALPLLRRPR